ncbi:MAG: DedA family protein [Leptolyngbya sp. PLA3]|nr:MAG: DedA family protein [Cyanobacteria bacterium CYA]MCE7968194.1 DedA family protein [Leptolyngbya sp. PL-A3]
MDFFLNLDDSLKWLIAEYGIWIYGLLFAVIFCETGLVVTPFLPGDSLLFAVGALAAGGSMNVWTITLTLVIAAVLGDAVNYHAGKFIGPRVFSREISEDATLIERLLNRKHLERAHAFFEKYGGKAVVLGRFVPIVRTFVPFVAGAGAMNYGRFVWFNITGAVLWVGLCIGAGWFFGNIPFVKEHFEAVVIGIIIVSLIPVGIEYVNARRAAAREVEQPASE